MTKYEITMLQTGGNVCDLDIRICLEIRA